MRSFIPALAALALLLAPTAAEAKGGQAAKLTTRDSLIHGVAGDAKHIFVSEPGIGVAKHGPRVVVLDRDSGREKAVLPAPPGGFKMPFTLRAPKPGHLLVLDSGGFPPQGPPMVYEYRYSTSGPFKATLKRSIDFSGRPLGFAEDVDELPDGALVVSESVIGGLWLVTLDNRIVPGMVPDDPSVPLPKLGPCKFISSDNTVGGLPLEGGGDFAPGVGSLAVHGNQLYFSSTCAGGIQRISIATLERTDLPAAARTALIKTVTPRKYDLESLKGITFNQYDKKDPWIYSGDPFRLQLIRVNSLTGKREVLSTNHKLFDFTTATTFLPPEHKGDQAPLVTVSDQEYRWATLNVALTQDMFRPPWTVADIHAGELTPAHRGGSGPPLVLLHGFTGSWHIWELVLERLERRYDVLAPTLAGHAGGPPLPAELYPTMLVEAVEAAMDEAGWTAHVVGNSLGGHVALQLAARGRARSVTAFAPAGGWEPGDASIAETLDFFTRTHDLLQAAGPYAATIASTPEGRRTATEFITVAYEHIPEATVANLIRAAAECPRTLEMIAFAARTDWALGPIECPVRFVWGTEDRLLPWPIAAARYRRELPQADWVELDGVGHCPQLDVPLETAELILGFA